MRPLRVGLICPYSLDVPGGVQNHVRDLAAELIARGHRVSVLAPSEAEDGLPDYVTPAGRALSVAYNGSVARVMFGPIAAARVRRWLTEGDFDVLHVHEPAAPSLGLIALGMAQCPIVGTFHMANTRSRAMSAAAGLLLPRLERLAARIAVSELARDTLVQHLGGEPVVIPNGLHVAEFAEAEPYPKSGPTIAFVGRIDEPRKGLAVLLAALPRVQMPGLRVLVVGPGDWSGPLPDGVELLGAVSDEEKARVLRTADVYVAPHLGGESFGIVLVEAMAAGACVLASDLPAFGLVLESGAAGALFRTGDAEALAAGLNRLLEDPQARAEYAERGRIAVQRYDWSRVAGEIEEVYDTVVPQ